MSLSLPLGEIAEINPPHKVAVGPDVEVSFLGMADLSELGTTTLGATRSYGEVRTGYTAFRTGDVLVAKITPCFQNGKIAQALLKNEIGAGSTEFHVVRPKDKVDARYLLRFLRQDWIRVEGELRMTGSGGQRRVPETYLRRLMVPLPPLSEQRRTAAVLDQVDALREKRRETITLLDDIAQSTFLEMFGDPSTNPKDFPVVKISDIARVGTGATPRRDDRSNYGGGIPWVKTGEVSGGVIHRTEESISESALSGSNCQIYPVGSIIVAMYGQGKTRGQCARLGISAATNQACAVVQPGLRVDGEFLFRQLLLSYDRLRGLGRGGNQENLNLALVRGFPVLLPHLDEQREYVQVITEMELVRARYVAHLAILDELFISLQHRAFSGTLWNHVASGEAP